MVVPAFAAVKNPSFPNVSRLILARKNEAAGVVRALVVAFVSPINCLSRRSRFDLGHLPLIPRSSMILPLSELLRKHQPHMRVKYLQSGRIKHRSAQSSAELVRCM
jgi:hypothetical protein